jgi:very-short-patch-repair endonuclease
MQHICKYCNRSFEKGIQLGGHTGRCKNNPNLPTLLKTLSAAAPKKLSEFHKAQIGKGMKEAHKAGRAWNIGQSRWNSEASYPEKFFMQVINNEFLDKNYIREYPIGLFSIDFAWPDKKRAIEIDGKQHEYPEQKERDKRKEQRLINDGWQLLRIQWKELFNNTKHEIKNAYSFIHNAPIA